ncbi:MAG: flagellar hook-basal body complex protein FliE [Steroidobacteraceae bacterium]
MSNLHIDSVLAQIRQLQQQTRINAPTLRPEQPGAAQAQPATSFANVLKQGLDRVNETQLQASQLAAQFERGVPGVELSQVMLESQKASVALRATAEVRNRLVSAYQDIMNMPI